MAIGFLDVTITVATDRPPFVPPPIETAATPDGLVEPYFYVVVYRPIIIDERQTYSLVYGLTQIDHAFAPGRLPEDPSRTLDWPVQQGDLIGAYIPYGCVNRLSDRFLMCTSQINFRTNSCLSAFYHPALNGVDNLFVDDFTEVLTELNMQVVLSPRIINDTSVTDETTPVIVSVLSTTVAITIIIITVVVIIWIIYRRKLKKSDNLASAAKGTGETPPETFPPLELDSAPQRSQHHLTNAQTPMSESGMTMRRSLKIKIPRHLIIESCDLQINEIVGQGLTSQLKKKRLKEPYTRLLTAT